MFICNNSTPQNQLKFPDDIDDVTDHAKDLICKLITTPPKRLGRNGVRDFQNHPFFQGIDWDELRESEYIHVIHYCTHMS